MTVSGVTLELIWSTSGTLYKLPCPVKAPGINFRCQIINQTKCGFKRT